MSDTKTVSIHAEQRDQTDAIAQAIEDRGGTVRRKIDDEGFIQLHGEFGDAVADDLRDRDAIRHIEDDPADLKPAAAPAPLAQGEPYGIETIGADVVHDRGEAGADATVAVLDTGINPEHPDVNPTGGRAYRAPDSADPSWSAAPGRSHGQHCGGTVAAIDNTEGVIGVAPDATLWSYRIFGAEGGARWSDTAAAIKDAVDDGADIISLSIGGPSASQTLKDAVNYADERGVWIVAASGNGSCWDCVGYPAAYPAATAVAATNQQDEIAEFVSKGPEVSIAAPGARVRSTVPGGYGEKSGTSMSTPHMAGMGALLVGAGATPHEARQLCYETAVDLGADPDAQGVGRGDVAAAHDQLRADGGTEPDMIDLTIALPNDAPGRAWYLIDIDGDAERTRDEASDSVSDAPAGGTRIAGRVAPGGHDTYRVTAESTITNANFEGAWRPATLTVGDDERTLADLPGFNPPPEEPTPEPPTDPTPGQGNPIDGNTYSPSQTRYNVQERPLFSDSDTRLVVDARNGDDSAAGDDGAPVRTIGEAFRRVPLFNQHQTEIVLEDQRHDADDNLFTPPTMANYLRTAGRITMRSRSRDPDECSVELPGGTFFSTGVQGASPLCAFNIEGVTFNCAIQNYGTLYAENCHFNGDADIWLKKCVGGYNSWQRFKQCEFGGDADYAIGLKHGLYADFFKCDIETGEAAAVLQAGAGSVLDWSGNTVTCPAEWGDERVERFIEHVY